MKQLYESLLELQSMDREITDAETTLQQFDPQLAQIEAPLKTLQNEVDTSRTRLAEMRQQSTKLEKAADSKRERLKTYESRLERVRNQREEAAVRAEMDLVRRAVEADEQEALELMEQARRTDLKLDEMERQLTKLRGEVEPRKAEMLNSRSEAEHKLKSLREERTQHLAKIDKNAARTYDRVRGTRNRAALAPLKADGACGNCFNIVPLQEQSEIRGGLVLRRCEACGVILYPES
jgi:predicted  nucleic acid-binding Zn-ribbon protein